MLIKVKRGWELPESAATPEDVFHNRRRFLKTAAAGPILLAAPGLLAGCDEASTRERQVAMGSAADVEFEPDPTAHLYPVTRNLRYRLDRDISPEDEVTTYNNYYEFGSSKKIRKKAQALPLRPWTVKIDGEVETPIEIGFDDLIAKMPLEERLYRHRCVEAWSMAVPYSGFPLSALVAFAKPKTEAKYLRMETISQPETMPGLKQFWYPWPYVEGLTLAEATNELSFIATGLYGKPIVKQNGAPLRLAVPWKYGFKHLKSIARFTFTAEQPVSFCEQLQKAEYGFWANVNPEFPHPRWSQAEERDIGTEQKIPTKLYNGYGEFVAELYKDLPQDRSLFM